MTTSTTSTPRLHQVGASPCDPFKVVGTATLLAEHRFVHMDLYPGADVATLCQPQTVALESNGYYVRARFVGTVVFRGRYGGPLGVENTHTWMPYAYEAECILDGTEHVWSGKARIALAVD